jgi:hypothetical protein
MDGDLKLVDYALGPLKVESVFARPVDLTRLVPDVRDVQPWKLNLLVLSQTFADIALIACRQRLVLLRLPSFGRIACGLFREDFALMAGIHPLDAHDCPATITALYSRRPCIRSPQVAGGEEVFVATLEDGSFMIFQLDGYGQRFRSIDRRVLHPSPPNHQGRADEGSSNAPPNVNTSNSTEEDAAEGRPSREVVVRDDEQEELAYRCSLWGFDLRPDPSTHPHPHQSLRMAVSSNSRRVFECRMNVQEPLGFRIVRSLGGNRHNVPSVAYSLGGTLLATAGIDGHLTLYPVNDDQDDIDGDIDIDATTGGDVNATNGGDVNATNGGDDLTASHRRRIRVLPEWGWAVGFVDWGDVHREIASVDYGSVRIRFVRHRQPPPLSLETLERSMLLDEDPQRVPFVYPPIVLTRHDLALADDAFLLQEADSDHDRDHDDDTDDDVDDDGESMFDYEQDDPDTYIRIPPSSSDDDVEHRAIDDPGRVDHQVIDGGDIGSRRYDQDGTMAQQVDDASNAPDKAWTYDEQREPPKQLLFYLSSKDLVVYDVSELLASDCPPDAVAAPRLLLHRILYGTVTPDQRAFFNNAALAWGHERYCLARWYAPLSCLFLGNQLGFVTIVHLRRRQPSRDDDPADKGQLASTLLTLPMGDSDVSPLAGMDIRPISPSPSSTYHNLYLLHVDGVMRVYLIRKVKK